MTLPLSIPRCPGMPREQAAEWPFPPHEGEARIRVSPDCLMDCARRRQGIADFMAGEPVTWMEPPKAGPCSEQLRPKP